MALPRTCAKSRRNFSTTSSYCFPLAFCSRKSRNFTHASSIILISMFRSIATSELSHHHPAQWTDLHSLARVFIFAQKFFLGKLGPYPLGNVPPDIPTNDFALASLPSLEARKRPYFIKSYLLPRIL